MSCIERTKYITPQELNQILEVGADYTEADNAKICLASEMIKYYLFRDYNWNVENCPMPIKIATAYQFKFMEENDLFSERTDEGFTIGKFSMNKGGSSSTAGTDNAKYSGYARKVLLDSGYVRRTLA